MIGQDKLLTQIDAIISIDKFPRFSIVVGERGMEHEDVARYIHKKMDADYIQLPDVKVDTIRIMVQQAYKLHKTTVFCIPDADDMSINDKNALLKVVEDTPNRAYFIMCLEDLSNTLATIQSRGIVFRMNTPSEQDIADFARNLYVNKNDIDEDVIDKYCKICSTPGDVIYFTHHDINNFYKYAEYVADNFNTVSGAEVFKFSDKLAIKDEEDKYDIRLFLKVLQEILRQRCDSLNDVKLIRCNCMLVLSIGQYLQDLKIKGVNRAMLLDNLWLELRRVWKSQM